MRRFKKSVDKKTSVFMFRGPTLNSTIVNYLEK